MTLSRSDFQDGASRLANLAGQGKLSRTRYQLVFVRLVISGSVLLVGALATAGDAEPADSRSLAPIVGKHETHRRDPSGILPHNSLPVTVTPDSVPSTRSSFFAAWNNIPEAMTYKLDVATDPEFQAFVDG